MQEEPTISVPKSVAEAFEFLDDMLTAEDKQKMLDGANCHFGLGLWMRNEWLYSREEEEFKTLLEDLDKIVHKEWHDENTTPDGMPSFCYIMDGDTFSGHLLDLYLDHLKEKK